MNPHIPFKNRTKSLGEEFVVVWCDRTVHLTISRHMGFEVMQQLVFRMKILFIVDIAQAIKAALSLSDSNERVSAVPATASQEGTVHYR